MFEISALQDRCLQNIHTCLQFSHIAEKTIVNNKTFTYYPGECFHLQTWISNSPDVCVKQSILQPYLQDIAMHNPTLPLRWKSIKTPGIDPCTSPIFGEIIQMSE